LLSDINLDFIYGIVSYSRSTSQL